ncbi:MAG TPA: hypothetical protein VJ739_04845, partial [Gemmataceae bacterium]|nr:hypothetical protein [Gemmataceae bacterium]
MAFRWFRKHQKVIWAGIVIISMITFVLLPTGAGQSIFDRLATSVGRNRSDPVTTLYGKTVSVRDLNQLRQQRSVAQQAFGVALGTASMQVQQRLSQLQDEMKKRLGPDAKGAAAFENSEEMSKLREEMRKLNRVETDVTMRFPDRRFVKGLDETNALLDFLIWRHQADRLGIQFTHDALDGQIRSMTGQRLGLDEVFGQLLNQLQGISQAQLEKALGDEFRVMLAQKAMLSDDPIADVITNLSLSKDPQALFQLQMLQMQGLQPSPVMGVPAQVTPYEFWKYYQEQRTALNVALLPVAVDPAAAKPTEQEIQQNAKLLRAMYDRYKNTEPRPDAPYPGFKQPRRLKLEWASADPSSAYYQKASAEVVAAARVVNLQSLATGGLLGGLPFVADPYYLTQYNDLKTFGRLNMAGLTEPDFALSIYASRPQPRDVTAFVGAALGAAGTGDSPLAALAAYQADTAQSNAGDK